MQIGIDVGATKIESVVLDENGNESNRERTDCPKDYFQIIKTIKEIDKKLEKEFNKELPIGVCHPGVHSPQTGLVKNAPNCYWLEKKPFQNDLRKELGKEVFCENDANCFALSEAFDGSAKNFKTVFGIILGSGCGGGLVIDKKIIIGPNSFTGEWGHIPIGKPDSETNIEEYISGKGLERKFTARFNKNLSAHEIFKNAKDNSQDEIEIIDEFKKKLARSLSLIINVIDPDAIVFGGGVSNEIESLDEIKKTTEKYLSNFNNIKNVNLKTIFLKPKFGDASGVRGAAILSKQNTI